MDRRTLVTALGASLVAPFMLRQATPMASPAGTDRPEPIDLGSGISLIDYRFHPGTYPAMIGEIRNATERMIDAPVVSITYPRPDRTDGFTWASPIGPVIDAGGTVPIFGVLPEDADPGTMLATATFALCSLAEPGDYTARQKALSDFIVVTVESERIESTLYNAQGTIVNTGPAIMRDFAIRGIVRDQDGRIAGTTGTPYYSGLTPDTPRKFSIWAGITNKANPFPLLSGTDYTVEIFSETRGPVIAPGCSFGRPWD